MRPVTVLYEDSAAPSTVRDYGPHLLVRQCVADELDIDAWRMQQLEGIPRRGNARIRGDCQQNPVRFVRDGRLAFAVYDADRLPALLGLPSPACKAAIKTVLLTECPWREQLRVVVLDRNLETVLRAILECAPDVVDARTRAAATEQKSLNARDIILKRVSSPAPDWLRVRQCVLARVPSLAYLVRHVAEACRA